MRRGGGDVGFKNLKISRRARGGENGGLHYMFGESKKRERTSSKRTASGLQDVISGKGEESGNAHAWSTKRGTIGEKKEGDAYQKEGFIMQWRRKEKRGWE